MLDKPDLAPGCFGRAFAYSADKVCGGCAFAANCKPLAERRMEQLKAFYKAPTPTRSSVTLSVKAMQLFKSLGRKREEIADAFRRGQNPFKLSEGAIGIVAHLALAAGEVKRPILQKILSDTCNVEKNRARFEVQRAVQILEWCNAVEVDGDTVRIIRG